jgi:hypothetical protein
MRVPAACLGAPRQDTLRQRTGNHRAAALGAARMGFSSGAGTIMLGRRWARINQPLASG